MNFDFFVQQIVQIACVIVFREGDGFLGLTVDDIDGNAVGEHDAAR